MSQFHTIRFNVGTGQHCWYWHIIAYNAYLGLTISICCPRDFYYHYSNEKWSPIHLNSAALQLFVQKFKQADTKGNIKAPHHWPFVMGKHRWLVDAPHKGPVMWKVLHYHDTNLYIDFNFKNVYLTPTIVRYKQAKISFNLLEYFFFNLPGANVLTLTPLGHFFFKTYFLILYTMSAIFFIWNWSNSSHSADYAPMCFPVFRG